MFFTHPVSQGKGWTDDCTGNSETEGMGFKLLSLTSLLSSSSLSFFSSSFLDFIEKNNSE